MITHLRRTTLLFLLGLLEHGRAVDALHWERQGSQIASNVSLPDIVGDLQGAQAGLPAGTGALDLPAGAGGAGRYV